MGEELGDNGLVDQETARHQNPLDFSQSPIRPVDVIAGAEVDHQIKRPTGKWQLSHIGPPHSGGNAPLLGMLRRLIHQLSVNINCGE